jgi:hypothetical protein
MKRLLALALFVLFSPVGLAQGLSTECDSDQMQLLANNIQAQAICDYLAPQTKESRAAHLQSLASASPVCYQKIMTDMADQIAEFNESALAKLDKLPTPSKEWYLELCTDLTKLDAVGASGDGR